MTIALVLPALPSYSETFINRKIEGLKNSGFHVVLMVVGVSQKRNMRIPVYYQPILASRGIGRWAHTLGLIANAFLWHPIKSTKLLQEAKVAGYTSFGKWRMLAVLSNFLKIQPDWIHFAFGTMAIERAFIGRVLKAKVGVSFRGYDICIVPVSRPGIYSSTWPYIDKVHCISKDLVSAARKNGLPEATPVEIIYPAIDAHRFQLNAPRNWDGKPRFLSVSRLHWKKGLEYTIQALSLVNFDFEYTIIGEGAEYENLAFAAYQCGIADKVKFAGKKSEADVTEAMQTHNYFLQYSVQEGFCNAVLEAQAAGMLCFVSDAEGLSENVLHEVTGWVVRKRNPKVFAERIMKEMILPSSLKMEISKRASERAKTSFSLSNQQQHFQKFFME